jgi:hypothetical protein
MGRHRVIQMLKHDLLAARIAHAQQSSISAGCSA